MRIFWILIAAVFICNNAVAQQPAKLIIKQKSDLYHKPVDIQAINLPPGKEVKFTLNATDAKNHKWHSEAFYISNSEGKIDLSEDKSVKGSYLGKRPMGLFWSMKSKDYHQTATHKGFTATISISIDGKILDEKTIYRKSTRELDKLKISLLQKRDTIIADYYVPESKEKLPAIIFIGGSGGGFRQERASLYASEGYAVLNLKYFRHEKLPKGIIEIPLEYVEKAFNWLSVQPEIDKNKIGIIGRSRGSELAMLYASEFAGLQFVIAQVPSNVVWFGWEDEKSSWSYKGKPYTYAEYSSADSERIEKEMKTKGVQYHDGPKFLSAFKNKEMIKNAGIKVENIKCPILFISGKDDMVWPSAMMSEKMMQRLRENNFQYEFSHLSYDNAGHNFGGGGQGCGIPFLPPEDYSKSSARGGTDEGNALAAIHSWNEILKFLKKHLKD